MKSLHDDVLVILYRKDLRGYLSSKKQFITENIEEAAIFSVKEAALKMSNEVYGKKLIAKRVHKDSLYSNSKIGSYHWLLTLLGKTKHVAEYLNNHSKELWDEDKVKLWARTIVAYCDEVLNHFQGILK